MIIILIVSIKLRIFTRNIVLYVVDDDSSSHSSIKPTTPLITSEKEVTDGFDDSDEENQLFGKNCSGEKVNFTVLI